VPVAVAEEVVDPNRLQEYVPHQTEELLPARQRMQELARELLK